MILRNPKKHSTEDNVRWSWLRAAEWRALPVYLSQPILPILLVFFPWYYVVPAILAAGVAWTPFRQRLVNVKVSSISGLFITILKWPATLAGTVMLTMQGEYLLAAVAVVWQVTGGLIGGIVCGGGPGIAIYQRLLLRKMGYKAVDG